MHQRSGRPVYEQVSPMASVDSLYVESDDDTAQRSGVDGYQHLRHGEEQQQAGGGHAVSPDHHHAFDTTYGARNLPVQGELVQDATIKRGRPSYWQRLGAMWMYGWVAETLGCVLAILSLLAMSLVLGLYQDEPLPEWPMGITLNALIAVFSILLKAGISIPLSEGLGHLKWQWFLEEPRKLIDLEEYDAAGRGPWGAFLFLFRFKFTGASRIRKSFFSWTRSDLLNVFAKLSAFLTVVGFVADPFTQQVLEYGTCQTVDKSAPAMLARTNMYWAPGGSAAWAAQEGAEDFDIAWAINMGLVERPEVPSFDCPTGNCTFPEFSTVGACHTCYDISDSIQNLTHRLPDSKTQPDAGHYPPYVWYVIPADAQEEFTGQLELANQTLLQSETLSRGPTSESLKTMRILSVPYDYETQTYGTPSASICNMDACVRTFRSEVTKSRLRETETGRVKFGYNWASAGGFGYNWSDDEFTDDTRRNYALAVAAEKGTTAMLPSPVTPSQQGPDCRGSSTNQSAAGMVGVSATDGGEILWYPPSCVYSLSYYANMAMPEELGRQLYDLWHGFSWMGPLETVPRVIYGDDGGVVDLDRINFIMGNVADSMTASMRSRGGTGVDSAGEYVSGVAYATVTCANVDWRWLAPSAVLVFLATMWLGILAWQSLRGEATKRGWKSSSLALLFSSLSEEKLASAAAAVDNNAEKEGKQLFDTTRFEMEEMATLVDTQLVRDEDGRARFI